MCGVIGAHAGVILNFVRGVIGSHTCGFLGSVLNMVDVLASGYLFFVSDVRGFHTITTRRIQPVSSCTVAAEVCFQLKCFAVRTNLLCIRITASLLNSHSLV